MAQCPKCSAKISKWKICRTTYIDSGKNRGFDCPKCSETLVVREYSHPAVLISLILALIVTIVLALFQRSLIQSNMNYVLLTLIMLANTIGIANSLLGVRLEAKLEPKKFYDPDRLE